MARKKAVKKTNKSQKEEMYDDEMVTSMMGSRVEYGLMSRFEESEYMEDDNDISKTERKDYGRAVNIKIPRTYHAQAKKSWEMYSTDRFFMYLINRCSDYGANGFEWEVSSKKGDIKSVKNNEKEARKLTKENAFWDEWAAKINNRVPNVMPGIDEINKWIFKQLLLGGMSPLEWEWGKMNIDGEMYEVPTRLTTHNVLSTLLARKSSIFLAERVFIKLCPTDNVTAQSVASQVNTSNIPVSGKQWHEVKILGGLTGKKQQGFVIKYNWTPGDNTSTAFGSNVSTGQGLYPQPPFYGLNEVLLTRRQLAAADIAILDGVINYIIDWSIGDNTTDGNGRLVNQPLPAKYDKDGTKIRKSTIETVKEMITKSNRGNVMQLFHPYYYKLDIKMPDINVLISSEKYIQTIVELLAAFGIFLSPTDRRVDFTSINTSNFEQFIENIRKNHIKRFWELLSTEIVKRNKDKLTSIPNMIFNPLNTQDDNFRTSLFNLAKIGHASTESLLKAHGLDKNTEVLRILREVASGEKDLMDENVPTSFVQETVNPNGDKKESNRSPDLEGGRPKGKTNEEE